MLCARGPASHPAVRVNESNDAWAEHVPRWLPRPARAAAAV